MCFLVGQKQLLLSFLANFQKHQYLLSGNSMYLTTYSHVALLSLM